MYGYKDCIFDIDGTIYSYEKGIPKDTAKAIELLKVNGHIPVICTGRTKCMIYPDFINLGFDNIIAGAGTYCEINGKELYYKKLEDAEARRVIDGFLEYGFFHWQKEKNIFMLELILLILFMQAYSLWTYIMRKFLIQLKQ